MRKSIFFAKVVFFLISEEACQNFTQPVVHKEPKVGCDEISRVSLTCTKFEVRRNFPRTKFSLPKLSPHKPAPPLYLESP